MAYTGTTKTTDSGKHSARSGCGCGGSSFVGDGLVASAVDGATKLATLLEPFATMLTVIVQAFTVWKLVDA